ncbi:MAG: hypothetical protein KBD19_04700 [Candidatus Moranbacteria bacterium]|nr:hypothetical protein [Candidatus Moranbacteria bacterium]
MKAEPYVVAATATRRNGYVLERGLFLNFLMASSKEEAEFGSKRLFLESTFKSDEWLRPAFGVDCIPEPRIRHYRDAFTREYDGVRRLTFLWGYAVFVPDRNGLRLGTIIARTKQDAAREIASLFVMRGHGHRQPIDCSILKVPREVVLPKPPNPEDAAELFRRRLEAYWRSRKNPRDPPDRA